MQKLLYAGTSYGDAYAVKIGNDRQQEEQYTDSVPIFHGQFGDRGLLVME
jgi:hypothetical protein